jgi:hypothetical protein
VAALRESLPPTGLAGDGPSRVYRRFAVAAGEHRLRLRLRDTARSDGFDHEHAATVSLRPGQNLVVDFRAGSGFVIR